MSELRKPTTHFDLDQSLVGIGNQLELYQKLLPQYLNSPYAQKQIVIWQEEELATIYGRSKRTFAPHNEDEVYFLGDYNLRIPMADFQKARTVVRRDTELLANAPVFPNAQWGVQALNRISEFGGYKTVRPNTQDVMNATYESLHKNGFPSPDKVAIYTNATEKLRAVVDAAYSNGGIHILVDDGLSDLVKAADELACGSFADIVRNQIVLAAFGVHPPEMADLQGVVGGRIYGSSGVEIKTLGSGLTVATLPNWNRDNVQGVMEYVNQRSRQ